MFARNKRHGDFLQDEGRQVNQQPAEKADKMKFQERIRIHSRMPKDEDGGDGDLRVVSDKGSDYLCVRVNGRWRKIGLE